MKRITIILGTRPEAIKFSPLILALKKNKAFQIRVILTGQHKEMVSQVLKLFDINFDNDLNLMMPKQTLNYITCETVKGLNEEFIRFPTDMVLVQGDTNTAFGAALAAFYSGIPVGHLEAGLRTNDLENPFPEEGNRRLISQIATLHFAPTKLAADNLRQYGIQKNIFITGNTVIDALFFIVKKCKSLELDNINWDLQKVLLVTVHRRENWGKKLVEICKGLIKILERNPEVALILPMHKNQLVREPIKQLIGFHERVILVEPLAYDELVFALKNCTLVLTDSGGLQEEAPSFGKPVLVLRTSTERQEAISAGTAKLIGTDSENIFNETNALLNDISLYNSMTKKINPYGDGCSSEKIIDICLDFLN